MLSSFMPALAHASGAGAGWIAWLPFAIALVLAVGVSLAADALFKTRTFGAGNARRLLTLGALVALASGLGLGAFHVVDLLFLH